MSYIKPWEAWEEHAKKEIADAEAALDKGHTMTKCSTKTYRDLNAKVLELIQTNRMLADEMKSKGLFK